VDVFRVLINIEERSSAESEREGVVELVEVVKHLHRVKIESLTTNYLR